MHEEKSCLSYIIGCPTEGVCAVVDPQGDPAVYLKQVDKAELKIIGVIETHIQADHISSAPELAEQCGKVLYYGRGADVHFAHQQLKDKQTIRIGNRRMKIFHTPGHTAEHICLLVDDWFVLTGDTLLVGDVGRVDLSLAAQAKDKVEVKALQLYRSLNKLLDLPDWVEVYPGHYAGSVCGKGIDGKPISTIGRERRFNSALRLSQTGFVDYITQDLPPPPADFLYIKRKNMGLDLI